MSLYVIDKFDDLISFEEIYKESDICQTSGASAINNIKE
jgi:hypothetical protein